MNKFAVIQLGYCTYGTGSTYENAITDAAKWMYDGSGNQGTTPNHVRSMIVTKNRAVNGSIIMITPDDTEFSTYVNGD